MRFELFDPSSDYSVRRGVLPHWYQPGATYFVTFRTADSVPQSLLRTWHAQRADWLRRHGIDPTAPAWRQHLRDQPQLDRQFELTFSRQFMNYLDQGHGSCPLAERRIANQVAESLYYFHGTRYHLGDFVIMPNHVHLLVCLLPGTTIEQQCRSWKRRTAAAINRALGRQGRLWQAESFDHLVRTAEHFTRFRRYIADNPRSANLKPGTYMHYVAKT